LRRRWLSERLGRLDIPVAQSGSQLRRTIWIHAVSVGEVAASVTLVRKLIEKYPQTDIVISTVTDTGQRVAAGRMGHLARIVYVPFDLPWCVEAAARAVQPSLFIIMETELWPNIIRFLHRRGVPIVLMNGRISGKSFRGYLKGKFFISRILGYFGSFCMQEEQYAGRIRLLGAATDKVMVTGNFKFDLQPAAEMPAWTSMLRGRTIIAGSTHRTEEDIVLDAYAQLYKEMPDLNLILAPRHPERFAEVEELVCKRNIPYMKRSQIKESAEVRKPASKKSAHHNISNSANSEASGKVIILDVIGELASVYGAADIAIMGGSFIEHGGQNPLEPAFWSKTIVCGPHMENFPFIGDFYTRGAAISADASVLSQTLNELLSSSEIRQKMGRAARALYESNAGSTDRALQIIDKYLQAKAAPGSLHSVKATLREKGD
jgi:3-deoxy-D-manno-octulosonic-acid transferase